MSYYGFFLVRFLRMMLRKWNDALYFRTPHPSEQFPWVSPKNQCRGRNSLSLKLSPKYPWNYPSKHRANNSLFIISNCPVLHELSTSVGPIQWTARFCYGPLFLEIIPSWLHDGICFSLHVIYLYVYQSIRYQSIWLTSYYFRFGLI